MTTISGYIDLRDVDGFFIESDTFRENFKFIIETVNFAARKEILTNEDIIENFERYNETYHDYPPYIPPKNLPYTCQYDDTPDEIKNE